MKKISDLTEEQKARFPEWVYKWVSIGLSTEPADFDAATKAALKAYELCNLKKPMVILRMGSPYAATIGGALAWTILRKFFGTQVGDQVRDQVWDQVGTQFRYQVRAQVWDQVGTQVGDQVWDQVGTQVRTQVRTQVWDQVVAQVRDQVVAQVRDQVWDQVRDQVRDQVVAQVWDQVGDQVGDQVRTQVWTHVGAQVGDQVGDQVVAQVRDQVGDQVWDKVKAENFQSAKDGFNNYGIDATWSGFAAWVSFFRDVCGWQDKILEKFEINETLVKSCGWTWWHKNVVVIADRPEYIKRDEQGRLHSQTGHSIHYRDGWGFSCWHGTRIPDGWTVDELPSAAEILNWPNAEQRRAGCEILGWAKILEEVNATVIDRDPNPQIGTLYRVDLPDAPNEYFLKYTCGTGREFAQNVDPAKTALQAQQWIWQDTDYQPEVRT